MFGTQEPDVYFYGETLQKLGEQKYKITRGGFTTCLQPTPRWELTSRSVTLNLEHYAILTNSLFKVKGVPGVLHADLLLPRPEGRPRDRVPDSHLRVLDDQGPVPEQRVLLGDQPQPGSHAAARLVLEDGPGLRSEYRYVRGPGSDGFLRFYNLREHEAQYDDTTTPERQSYEVRGAGTQRIGRAVRARFRADYFSDIQVQQTYHQNVYEASRRQRVFSGSVGGAWREYTITGTVDRSEYFYGTTSSTVRGGAPRLLVNRNERPLFGSFAYLAVNTEYNRLIVAAEDRDRACRPEPDAVRHPAANPRAVHEVAIPDGELHGGVPLDSLDARAATRLASRSIRASRGTITSCSRR